ncbi:hypothetical protein [Allorhizobium terrae]|uniref:Response regulatory domain-containing protein n=1 Tax=Allorhizobium terrae TaxID=1848972 RepID=A0A4S3ZVL4_9HYPH|nr:hypothetical protein [Allorhizobium terrae]THF49716.1 hypothetical protein E6C51_12305 [Allorhizobium terrae]TWD50783.1 hypothetical protein FB480_106174 [Agrobacterium vitis]
MNGFVPRILIADNNYMIGLEAQRILTETRPCAVEICRRDDLAQALAASFDLVFVDAAPTAAEQVSQAEIVRTHRAGLVFMHTGQLLDHERVQGDVLAVFEKPFYEQAIRDFMTELNFNSSEV